MKTIEQQTGWKRPSPLAICQDLKVLKKVKIFNFDLKNEEFRQYFIDRVGIAINDTADGTEKRVESIDPGFPIRNAQLQDCWELYIEKNESIFDIVYPMILAERLVTDKAKYTGNK